MVTLHIPQYRCVISDQGEREQPALRIVIEWPSRQAAVDFMNDPGYVPHLEQRTAGSVSHHALVEAKDDLA
ncbi:hypothetical protein BCT94_14280 [Vibrio breoganii]|nr:hypothetical protein BCU06_05935 [Vibrio breoganii]PMK58194.1 hypothetical protein BCT98_06880 [Vibrio breoganii]PMK71538.1 hypothetical protein BCT94_14280 [Vibrio breoganii]